MSSEGRGMSIPLDQPLSAFVYLLQEVPFLEAIARVAGVSDHPPAYTSVLVSLSRLFDLALGFNLYRALGNVIGATAS
jgi:hypothetical protein